MVTLAHPIHGFKMCDVEAEIAADKASGWTEVQEQSKAEEPAEIAAEEPTEKPKASAKK